MVDVIAQLGLHETVGGDDGDVILERLTAQEHPRIHRGAVGERDLDRPAFARHIHRRLDHIAVFLLAIGRGDIAPVDDRGRAGDHQILAPRNRVQGKAHLGLVLGAESFDVERMQRRCPRAGIDLGADRGHAQTG